MYYTWIGYCSRRYCKKLHAAQATHATGQRLMPATRTDLQKLEIFGKVESPSCLNSERALEAFVVGENTVVCGIRAYKSTQSVLILAPAHLPRVALTYLPRYPARDYCTNIGRCHSRPKKLSLSRTCTISHTAVKYSARQSCPQASSETMSPKCLQVRSESMLHIG